MTRYYAVMAVATFVGLAACSPKPASAPSQTDTAPAVVPAETALDLNCSVPAGGRTTAAVVLKTFGADAVKGDIAGAEGLTQKGVILYPNDTHKKLDIAWWDDAQTAVSQMRASEPGSAWMGPAGLHIGSTLAEVEAANGKPFTLSGFGWDYGGYAVDYQGGKLETIDGGCHLMLRFDSAGATAAIPDGLSGDSVQLSSDDARLKTFGPVVTEMSIGWALPNGVKPAGDQAGD